MKKNNLVIIILFFLVLIIIIYLIIFLYSKKTENNTDQKNIIEDIIIDPSLLNWEKITTSAPWQGRDSHAVLVFKDEILLMGGLDGTKRLISPGNVDYGNAQHFSDVWSSKDGKEWKLLTDKAPWGERRSMQVAYFKGKIWLMGGWGPEIGYKNDIWSSEDGINWKMETNSPNWPAREGHQLLVFNNKIWLLGGVKYTGQQLFNDVWSSEDGVSWENITKNADWDPRWDFASAVFDDKLWVIGGMAFGDKIFNDVWSSEDGRNWSLVNNNPKFGLRQGLLATGYKNKLWVIGKLNIPMYGGGVNDIWFSEDGVIWQKTKKDPLWTGREDVGMIIFKDKIWIIGGMDSNWEWKNDVWCSTNY